MSSAVVDDDNTDIVTVGSLVTVSVTLYRSSLLEAGLLETSEQTPLDFEQNREEVWLCMYVYVCLYVCDCEHNNV